MCCFTAVVKRVIPFVVAFVAGTLGFSFISQLFMESAKGPQTSVPSGSGIGGASRPSEMTPVIDFKGTESFRIISKPQARYTDEARINNVEGKVRLKVVLLASGKLGNIWAVSNLPHGLTEQAVAAARNIKFQPKRVNGVPQSVTVTIDYNFNLY